METLQIHQIIHTVLQNRGIAFLSYPLLERAVEIRGGDRRVGRRRDYLSATLTGKFIECFVTNGISYEDRFIATLYVATAYSKTAGQWFNETIELASRGGARILESRDLGVHLVACVDAFFSYFAVANGAAFPDLDLDDLLRHRNEFLYSSMTMPIGSSHTLIGEEFKERIAKTLKLDRGRLLTAGIGETVARAGEHWLGRSVNENSWSSLATLLMDKLSYRCYANLSLAKRVMLTQKL